MSKEKKLDYGARELRDQGSFLKWVVIGSLGLLLAVGIAGGGEYVYQKVWGVRTADVRREVFEESKSFVHGTIRDIENLAVDYAKADSDTERAIIKQTVLHRVSTFDTKELPEHLVTFVEDLRKGDSR